MSKVTLIGGATEGIRKVPGGVAGRMIREVAEQRDLWAGQIHEAMERLPETRQAYLRGAADTLDFILDRLLQLLPDGKPRPDQGDEQEEGDEK